MSAKISRRMTNTDNNLKYVGSGNLTPIITMQQFLLYDAYDLISIAFSTIEDH